MDAINTKNIAGKFMLLTYTLEFKKISNQVGNTLEDISKAAENIHVQE